jgi:hypothetical protein
MINFVTEGAWQKAFSRNGERLSVSILCANGDFRGATGCAVLSRIGKATLLFKLLTLGFDNNGIYKFYNSLAHVDNTISTEDADLRRGKTASARIPHSFNHIIKLGAYSGGNLIYRSANLSKGGVAEFN